MKIFLKIPALILFIAANGIYAQEAADAGTKAIDTTWTLRGIASVNMTQAYYENWVAGGVPSVSGVAFLKAILKYEKEKWRWENIFDLGYGLINEREKKMRKTDDRIQFDSKLGYSIGKAWYGSLLASYKSQFSPGYEDVETQKIKISDFMSPAYVNLSLGFDHNPNEHFSLFIAPASVKATIVLDQDLANAGAFGVEAGEWETIVRDTNSIDSVFVNGQNIRYEFGAHLKMLFKKNVMKNVDFLTRLELFANYFENFGNIDVNWDALLDMKINNYLSASLRVEVIYDDDINVKTKDSEGNEIYAPRMQLKEIFGLGLSYRF